MSVPFVDGLLRPLEKIQSQLNEICEVLQVDNLHNALQKVKRLVKEEEERGRLSQYQKRKARKAKVQEKVTSVKNL